MKDFANAAFEPELIEAMTAALTRATLPEPLSSARVSLLPFALNPECRLLALSGYREMSDGNVRPAARSVLKA
jgi:hypothetical protein